MDYSKLKIGQKIWFEELDEKTGEIKQVEYEVIEINNNFQKLIPTGNTK